MNTGTTAQTASLAETSASATLVPAHFQSTTATLMFTDVEDSTGLAIELGLTETTHFLIEHVAMVHHVVVEGGGIVQNFTGDGVLALWSDMQMPPKETALRGLAAAADLAIQVSASNAWRRSRGLLTRRLRIGLHTGEVMLVDDHQRNFSFVVGSEVNFARRVEQAGKKECGKDVDSLVMVSGATLRRADFSRSIIDPHGFHRLTADQLGALSDCATNSGVCGHLPATVPATKHECELENLPTGVLAPLQFRFSHDVNGVSKTP